MASRGADIFKKGQKVDIFDDAEAQPLSAEEFHAKVQEWKGVWTAPRRGPELSIAKWIPHAHLAEVKHKRGRYLQKMGVMCRGRQYLTIEEVVYLVDRSSMLLIVDTGLQRDCQLSRQECYELMAHEGVSMAAFQVYTQLMRKGFLVRRYPVVWIHNEGPLVSIHAAWQPQWTDSAQLCASSAHPADGAPVADEADAGEHSCINSDAAQRDDREHANGLNGIPASGAFYSQSSEAEDTDAGRNEGRDQEWVTASNQIDASTAFQSLERPVVELKLQERPCVHTPARSPSQADLVSAHPSSPGSSSMQATGSRFSRLKPLATWQGAADIGCDNSGDYRVRFAVYTPTEHFSRRTPGSICSVVAFSDSDSRCFPTCVEDAQIRRVCQPHMLRYAKVMSGDLVFVTCRENVCNDLFRRAQV